MFWSRFRRLSLTVQLMSLLVPAMLGVVTAELLMTRSDVLNSANAAFDRSLAGALRSLDANVATASGGLSIELPYQLFEFFQLTANGPVYFRVATADGLVEIGSPDLPLPDEPMADGQPVFYDGEYFGEALRLGAYARQLDSPISGSPSQRLIIQVAENTRSREQFSDTFLWRAATRDGVVLSVVILVIALIVALALRPLTRLAQQVRGRSDLDMTPIPEQDLPADVVPLVGAVNQQLQRTHGLMAQQRAFVDDASHQLRTSLATLRAQVDYGRLTRHREDIDETLKALATQLDQATHGTNQLLALARSDTAQLQLSTFTAADLLREVALQALPLARQRQVDFGVDCASTLLLTGDRALLREALGNLTSNAIRHVPVHGEITLSAGTHAGGMDLTVTDNGSGMPQDMLARVGQRFLRGQGSAGAGLGLAIASAVAQRHGGALLVRTRPDIDGTRVRLQWPQFKAGPDETKDDTDAV